MTDNDSPGDTPPIHLGGEDLQLLAETLQDLFTTDTLDALGFFALGKTRDEFSHEGASRPELANDLVVTASRDERLRELLLRTQEFANDLKTTKGDALVALTAELLQRPPGAAGIRPSSPQPDPYTDPNADLCRPGEASRDTGTEPTTHLMLPFAITAERAQEICRAWFGSDFAHPRDLKTLAQLAAPTGVYLPAWQWSGHAVSTWTAMAVFFERRERTLRTAVPQPVSPGAAPPAETTEVEVIRRAPVPVSGDHEKAYPATWVLAFAGPPWLQTAWPTPNAYDLNQVAPFDARIAAPHRVEPPMIDRQAARRTACEKIRDAEQRASREQMPGDEVDDPVVKTRVVSLEDVLVELPVWRVSYDYKGKPYACHVNGQSGTAVCHGPTDTARKWGPWIIGIVVVVLLIILVASGGGRLPFLR